MYPQRRNKRVSCGVTSLAKPVPIHHAGEQRVSTHCPQQRGAGGGLPSASQPPPVLWLLGRLRAACWEADTSRAPAMGHARGAFGCLSCQGAFLSPWGRFSPCLKETRSQLHHRLIMSVVTCVSSLRREHEVQDVAQDPDISCLLFPSCSSAWCQHPRTACFPAMFSNCALGKLVRHDVPWDLPGGPGRRSPVIHPLCCMALGECCAQGGGCPLCDGDRWVQGCPGRLPELAASGDHKEEEGTGRSLEVWSRNRRPPRWR